MVSVEEAAEKLGVTRRRVYALIEAGKLTASKISGVWLVDEDSLKSRVSDPSSRMRGRPRKGSQPEEVNLVLMNREHALADVIYDARRNVFTSVSDLFDKDRVPLGVVNNRGRLSVAVLSSWWSGRGIPHTRRGLAQLLEQSGAHVPEELVFRNLGLSLSDQYWVKPAGSDITWKDVNFFQNNFEELELDSKSGTDSARHPDNTSDGMLEKHWMIDEHGTRMLVKAGGPFSQEPCNEVIATELCRRIMAKGEYVPYSLTDWRGRLASRCNDFLTDEEEYIPAHYVRQIFEQAGNHTDYQHYLECCYSLGIRDARDRLSRQIVCDDLMANTDRHWRNFGIVRNVETLQCRIAPIFDTGTSLWCDREDLLRERDYTFSGKQFEQNPGRQLQLADLDWLNTDSLQNLDEYARDVLGQSSLGQARIDQVCEGIRWRVKRMTNICEYL